MCILIDVLIFGLLGKVYSLQFYHLHSMEVALGWFWTLSLFHKTIFFKKNKRLESNQNDSNNVSLRVTP